MPPREISPAPLPTPTHSYQLEIGSIIGSLASDQRPGYDFFYFITFGHRLLATIIKNGGHDSDFIYLPLTTSIDMPHILRSKPASNTSGRTLSHRGCYHLSPVEQESNFPCISFSLHLLHVIPQGIPNIASSVDGKDGGWWCGLSCHPKQTLTVASKANSVCCLITMPHRWR